MKKLALTLFLFVTALQAGAQKPVSFSHEMTENGSEAVIEFYGEIQDGFYMYSTDIPKGGPRPTSLRITEIEGAELVGDLVPEDEPKTKYEEAFNMQVKYFTEYAVFSQKIRFVSDSYRIKGRLQYQSCGVQGCVPGRYDFEITGKAPAVASVEQVVDKEDAVNKAPAVDAVEVRKVPAEKKDEVSVVPVVEKEDAVKRAPAVDAVEVRKVPAEKKDEVSVVPVVEKEDAVKKAPAVDAAKDAKTQVVAEDAAPVKVDGQAPAEPQQQVAEENAPVTAPEQPTVAEVDTWAPVVMPKKTNDNSIWTIFILGFGGGLLALLTPCVWPIIPMTVSFFLKRSKEKKQAVREAIVYGISIILIYLVLGLAVTLLFGPAALNELATNAYFNVFFFLLLLVFGASFLGGFELKLPSSWTNKVDAKASSTTGWLSIFFMAFTLALVSFSCTGPIIGFLLVETATSGDIFGPAVGMFGFALALALPFTLFAIFPSLLKQTPRSGGWMNTIKVVLGFVEIAFALKFLSVADLTKGWGILDRETFLALWIVLFASLGLYLLKVIRFPHDDPEDKKTSVPAFFTAWASLAFAVYMIPGLWGAPCKAISAFAPPMWTQDFSLYDNTFKPDTHDYDEAIRMSRETGKPIFLDFTGHGCVNCREMEAAVLSEAAVLDILRENYIVASLYVDDRTELPEPFIGNDGLEYNEVGEKWTYLQQHKFGELSQPFYVLVDSDGKPLNGSFAFKKDVGDFIDFLNEGLENFKK